MKSAVRKRIRPGRALLLALAGVLVVSFVAALALRFADPPFTAVMIFEPGSVAQIEHEWVSPELISVHAARAVIAAEDQRFLDHHGLDFNQISSAVEHWQRGGDLRGASTITQQVAKNVFLWNGRSFVRKGLDAWLAIVIDAVVPKNRILEIYLNVAEFDTGVFGIEAAARHYFGRSASELSLSQAAALSAVLPAPKRLRAQPPSDYVQARAQEIIEQVGLLESRGHYRGLVW